MRVEPGRAPCPVTNTDLLAPSMRPTLHGPQTYRHAHIVPTDMLRVRVMHSHTDTVTSGIIFTDTVIIRHSDTRVNMVIVTVRPRTLHAHIITHSQT